MSMSTTPFKLCLAPELGATPIRAPLPSNTQGPASFLGVIGPSCALTGPPLLGLGVLRPLIANGSDVACEPSLPSLEDPIVEGVLAPPLRACSDAA